MAVFHLVFFFCKRSFVISRHPEKPPTDSVAFEVQISALAC